MNPAPDHEERLAGEPVDATDVRVLAAVRAAHDALDPVPPGLVDRITFAMSVASLEAEVARIVSDAEALTSVRGADYDRADTVTFASDGLSVMVSLEPAGPGRVDVVGWASEGEVDVELRERSRTRTAGTDPDGRFTFAGVERGLVNFVLRRRGRPDAPPVITPAIDL